MLCRKKILSHFANYSQTRNGSFKGAGKKISFAMQDEFSNSNLTEKQRAQYAEFLDDVSFDQLGDEAANVEMRHNKYLQYKNKNKMRKLYVPKGSLQPNMMTWAMKQNIKTLNTSNPEVWTPHTLAKSFPTNVEGIKKILKSKWQPGNEDKQKKHDLKVAENWATYGKNMIGSSRLLAKSTKSNFGQYSNSTDVGTYQGAPNLSKVAGAMSKLRDEERLQYCRDNSVVHPVYRKKMENHISFRSIISNYNNKNSEELTIRNVDDVKAPPIIHQDLTLGDDFNPDKELDKDDNYVKMESKFIPKKDKRYLTIAELNIQQKK